MSCKAQSPDQSPNLSNKLKCRQPVSSGQCARTSCKGPVSRGGLAAQTGTPPGEAPEHGPQIIEAQREELDEFFKFWILCSLRSTCTFSQLGKLKN